MAETALATASERQVWETSFVQEYIRSTRFQAYMTNSAVNSGGIILTKFQKEEEAFRTINIPFIARLQALGVTGAQVLDGMEEELVNYNMPITVDWRRNAVRIPKSTSFRTEVDLWNAGKTGLNAWVSEKLRDDIIRGLFATISDTAGTTVSWDLATAANKNTFTAANKDRMLFGNLNSQYNATFATAIANVVAGQIVTTGNISKMKRLAKSASPHIRPFRVDDGSGREYYVCFHGARTFRDLGLDNNMVTANQSSRAREAMGIDKNPLFQDGDLLYQGVIHREVPEIDDYASANGYTALGGGGADIRPVFLCGAGAVGVAWGQMPTPRTDLLKDYQFRPGVAIEELLGVKKINFNGVQNGVVTGFFASTGDA